MKEEAVDVEIRVGKQEREATDRHGQGGTDTDRELCVGKQEREDPDRGGLIYEELTYKIIGLAMEVRKGLGLGFNEKVYENSMRVLFKRDHIKFQQQAPLDVYFLNENVGHYAADFVVEDKVIVEMKAAEGIVNEHRAQVLNYLKATGLRIGLILNFGPARFDYERIIV